MVLIYLYDKQKKQKGLRPYLRAGWWVKCWLQRLGVASVERRINNEKWRGRRGYGITAEMKEIRNLKGKELTHSWVCQSWIANRKP